MAILVKLLPFLIRRLPLSKFLSFGKSLSGSFRTLFHQSRLHLFVERQGVCKGFPTCALFVWRIQLILRIKLSIQMDSDKVEGVYKSVSTRVSGVVRVKELAVLVKNCTACSRTSYISVTVFTAFNVNTFKKMLNRSRHVISPAEHSDDSFFSCRILLCLSILYVVNMFIRSKRPLCSIFPIKRREHCHTI